MKEAGQSHCGAVRRQRSLILLFPALINLAACTTTGARPAHLGNSNAAWLVGAWVIDGESCSGDAGVQYNADGTWEAEDVAGRWRLRGNALELTVTHRDAPDLEGAPRRIKERIEMQNLDRFVARRGDGSGQTFKRCRG